MKRSRENIASPADLYDRALKLLAQKSRSRWELHRLLEKRCEDAATLQAVLDKCVAHGYLDDIKYAVQLARFRAERKKQGRRRVALELKAKGIPVEIAEHALEEVFRHIDEDELLHRALEAKLKEATHGWTAKKTKKLYDQMVRAGFNTDCILREFRRCRIPPVPTRTVSGEEDS